MYTLNRKKSSEGRQAAEFMPKDSHSLQILHERAAHYARAEITKDETMHLMDYIRFRLNKNEYYGIPYQYAKEVIENATFTKVPFAIDCIAGVINRRGIFLTLLDLKKFFQLNNSELPKNVNIIVLEFQGMSIGILADYIVDSDTYDTNKMTEVLPYEGVIDNQFILGIHNGSTAILNIPAMMADLKNKLKQQEK